MENLYLAHHGIKGQKWGVRRSPAQLGHDAPAEGGGGGGGVELDPEELKKLKERLEVMASDNFSDEEIMKLVNGKPVEKTLVDDKGKKTYMFKETFVRDGNSLKYQRQQFEMTAPNTYRHINKDINTTLDDIDGNKPFTGISVKKSKAQQAAVEERQKSLQKEHQREVDKKIARAPISEKQRQHREDVDRRIAEGKRQKQRQHQYEVDRTIRDAKNQKARQEQHKLDVDRKIRETQSKRSTKQTQHRADVDRRIQETKTAQSTRQSQHKADVDRTIQRKREWDRNVDTAKRTVGRAIDDAKRGADETLYRIRRRIEGL